MQESTKAKLKEAQEYCDLHDKSTPFMVEYMKDFAGVDHDCVIKYLTTEGGFREVSPNKAKRLKKSGEVI